jgi:hypothetical protein
VSPARRAHVVRSNDADAMSLLVLSDMPLPAPLCRGSPNTRTFLRPSNFIKVRMPTKDDVRVIVREELNDLRSNVKAIRTELDELNEKVNNITGYRKEIDHALERIAAIEKHLGTNKKIAA